MRYIFCVLILWNTVLYAQEDSAVENKVDYNDHFNLTVNTGYSIASVLWQEQLEQMYTGTYYYSIATVDYDLPRTNFNTLVSTNYRSYPSIGLGLEYKITDQIGFGLNSSLTWANFDVSYKDGAKTKHDVYKLRILPVVSFYMEEVSRINPNAELFFSMGVGYVQAFEDITTTTGQDVSERSMYGYFGNGPLIRPVLATELAVNFRYYVHKNIGIHSRMSLGGPVMMVGVTYTP